MRSAIGTRTVVVRTALVLIAAWGVLSISAVTAFVLASDPNPDHRAIIQMGVALIGIWCVLGGALMIGFRSRFVRAAGRIPLGWRSRFVLLSIVFALIEEAVTTTLTNLAPWFGGVTEAARITASTNDLEVVLLHSVIVFVPMFVGWAWLLGHYDFRPAEVLLLFGLTGTLAETLAFGPQNLIQVGMWTYVYGLMVWLPAATVPPPGERGIRKARWWSWPLAVFLPLVFVIPLALGLVVQGFRWAWCSVRSIGRPGSESNHDRI